MPKSRPVPCVKIFPIASLPRVCMHADPSVTKMLKNCFVFERTFKVGWIRYNPTKITVLSSNDMFEPLYSIPPMFDIKKQTFKVHNAEDLETLEEILCKPIMMCVSRRQQFPHEPSKSTDFDSIKTHKGVLTNTAFDIDFIVLFSPSSIRREVTELLKLARTNIHKENSFCVKVDLKDALRGLVLPEHRHVTSDEFVSWHNSSFWVTNYCKPHHTLMYVNSLTFWTLMFPYSFFIALPYRIVRRAKCKDFARKLNVHFMFDAIPNEELVVCLWSSEKTSPGQYLKFSSACTIGVTEVKWLKSLLHSDGMTFVHKFEDKET